VAVCQPLESVRRPASRSRTRTCSTPGDADAVVALVHPDRGDTALIIVDWDLDAMLPAGTGISPTGTTTAVARRSADGS
jgi:hypothetical protein